MKLNKRIFAVIMAAVMMLVCAVPAFAEGAVSEGDAALLIAPAASASDLENTVSITDVIAAAPAGADAPASVSTSFMVMGYGMLGIFVVMIIIMLVILLLNVATKPRKK